MLDLAEYRRILGDAGEELTNEQLEQLRAEISGLAKIIVRTFAERRERADAGTLCPTR